MVNSRGYPRTSAYSLKNRMKTEWKVPMTRRLALRSPTIRAILSFISPAALRVNVSARMREGSAPFASRYAILLVSTLVLPEPAPATIKTGPSVHFTASRCVASSCSKISYSFFSITAIFTKVRIILQITPCRWQESEKK